MAEAASTQLDAQIRSQPEALEHMLIAGTVKAQVHAAAEALHRVRRIWVVATGTSQHAAFLGAAMLQDAGFQQIDTATRIVIFTPELAAGYFGQAGRSAHRAGVIDPTELDYWIDTITGLHGTGRLFATIGYFLFTART